MENETPKNVREEPGLRGGEVSSREGRLQIRDERGQREQGKENFLVQLRRLISGQMGGGGKGLDETEESQISFEYQGAYYKSMKPDRQRLGIIAKAADMRSRVVVKAALDREVGQNGVYLQLGEVAARGGWGNIREMFKRRPKLKDYEIVPDFDRGVTEVKIRGEVISDRIVERDGMKREVLFKREFDKALREGLREAIRREKTDQIINGLKVTVPCVGAEIGALAYTAFEGWQVAGLAPSWIDSGRSVLMALVIPTIGALIGVNLAGVGAVEGLGRYAKQRPEGIIEPEIPRIEDMPGGNFVGKAANFIRALGFLAAPIMEIATRARIREQYFSEASDFNPFKHLKSLIRGANEVNKTKLVN